MKEDLVCGVKFTSSILCVVDFSESSKRSIAWSVQMALLLNLHITLLHTFRLLQYNKEDVFLMKRKKESESLSRFVALEKTLLTDKRISYDFKTEVGLITDRINHFIVKNVTSLIVINKTIIEENRETFEELLSSVLLPIVIIS